MTGTEWTLTAIVITTAAILGLTGPRACRDLRTAILRARWAWRCRGKPPVRSRVAPLKEREREELDAIARGLKGKATRPERTRT
jgi:uncharacterized membrane protein